MSTESTNLDASSACPTEQINPSELNSPELVIEVLKSSVNATLFAWHIRGSISPRTAASPLSVVRTVLSNSWSDVSVRQFVPIAKCAENLADSYLSHNQYLLNSVHFVDIDENEVSEFCNAYNRAYLAARPNTLLILPLNETAQTYYENHGSYHAGDSGLDLFCLTDQWFSANRTDSIHFGIACEAIGSFYLVSRSSISKTRLRMANCIGIIDQGYRGELIAAVDCLDRESPPTGEFVTAGTRLFQIVFPDLRPINMVLTKHLSKTARGSGGFGSTSSLN